MHNLISLHAVYINDKIAKPAVGFSIKPKCFKVAGKDRPLHHGNSPPHAAQKVPVRGHSSSFFLISFPDLWLTSPLHVMTWHMNDDVAVVWTSTALRANRYSCTLVWAEWVRAHEGWRKDGFGRELDPQSCTTGKSIPVCGLTELAVDFTFYLHLAGLTMLSLTYIYMTYIYIYIVNIYIYFYIHTYM